MAEVTGLNHLRKAGDRAKRVARRQRAATMCRRVGDALLCLVIVSFIIIFVLSFFGWIFDASPLGQGLKIEVTIDDKGVKWTDIAQALGAIGAAGIAAIAGYIAWMAMRAAQLAHLFSRVDEHNRTVAASPAWQISVCVYLNLPIFRCRTKQNGFTIDQKKIFYDKNATLASITLPPDPSNWTALKTKRASSRADLISSLKVSNETQKADLTFDSEAFASAQNLTPNDLRIATRILHLSNLNLVHQAWQFSAFWRYRRPGQMRSRFPGWIVLAQRIVADARIYGTFAERDEVDKPIWYCLGCRDIAAMIFDRLGEDDSGFIPSVWDEDFIAWLANLDPLPE